MTDQQHTPELDDFHLPLRVERLPHGSYAVKDSRNQVVVSLGNHLVPQKRCRRIVACVNACEGHATNMLESVPGEGYALTSKRMIDRVVRIENLNAEMVEVVKGILWYEGDEPGGPLDDAAVLERASVVLAKAKGADDE